MLFIAGLWPFNFNRLNEAQINSNGGLVLSKPGTAYTAASIGKLHNPSQLAVFIDLTTSSTGLSSFEKIFSYSFNQEAMNFIVGQWKDGLVFPLRADNRPKDVKIGLDEVLNQGERAQLVISYDGNLLEMYQGGTRKRYYKVGPLTFSGWTEEYPLMVGTDAKGKSQWKGTIYEIAVYDRALTSGEVMGLSGRDGGVSPFTKGGSVLRQAQDGRPLIHYVFRPENTYETEIRGKKALGVRDLGKGEPADLVIPERFTPYKRAYLQWDHDWYEYRSNWLDLAVNILGFVPFGLLLLMQFAKRRRGFGIRASGFGIKEENPPVSPFAKGGGLVVAVILAVVAGFVVSFAIEYLQAYLPSRDSSLRDLITNVLGTAIGAIAAAWLVRCRQAAAVDELMSRSGPRIRVRDQSI